MISAVLPQPLTARMFLSGDSSGPDVAELISRSLREQGIVKSVIGGVRHLSTSALQSIHDEIVQFADGFLDVELGDILLAGWRKHRELVGAAERTLAVPGSKEMVILAAHRVSSTPQLSVELLVDEVRVHTFVFELTVEFDLTGVVAMVQHGELVALRGGECALTVSLALAEKPLLPTRTARVDLALIVALNPAVPLLHRGRNHP